MLSSHTCTQEQLDDLKKRLISFSHNNIMPALQAFHQFKAIITSSERLANPTLCVNKVNLQHEPQDQICKMLTTHYTHGFYNIALERHNYLECADLDALRKAATERLYCSFVFVIDIQSIADTTQIARKKELSESISEIMYEKAIDKKHIQAILIAPGLEKTVQSVFPTTKIVTAPLRRGTLTLSSFTRGTAICSKNNESSITDITIPDYNAALKEFIRKFPKMTQFVTHISRFSTQDDLKNPFVRPTKEEQEKIQTKQGIRAIKLMFQHNGPDLCEFIPEKENPLANSTTQSPAKAESTDCKKDHKNESVHPKKSAQDAALKRGSSDTNQELNDIIVSISLFKKTKDYSSSLWKPYYDRLYNSAVKEVFDRVSDGRAKLIMQRKP